MTCFDKDSYKSLKRSAKAVGDVYVTQTVETEFDVSGVTVAYRPAIENTNGRMLEVAVSYCSPEDVFKKKHGKYQALLKLSQGVMVHVPLAGMLRDEGPESVDTVLLTMFAGW